MTRYLDGVRVSVWDAVTALGRRAQFISYAFGGPCDGQRLRLPSRLPFPAQLLLHVAGQHGQPSFRYVRVASEDGPPTYRYEALA